ncbi:MAG TPA: chemotaxis protein CheW [Thermoanaerobaculia bacterium]|nr:chemotaxis protein CheW [Thermoanaerobaculia bacterium]
MLALAGTAQLQRNPRRGGPIGWLLDTPEELPVFALEGRPPGPPGHRGAPASEAGRLPLTEDGSGVVVVVAACDGPPFGLRVDAVEGEHEVSQARLRPLPGLAAACVSGFSRVVLWDDALALELAATRPDGPGSAAMPPAGGEADAAWPAGADSHLALPPVSSAQSRRLFVFTLPGAAAASPAIVLGLAASQAVEVVDGDALRPVPGARAPLLGLIGWRGEPLAVVDLASALGLAEATGGEQRPPAAAAPRLLVARAAAARELIALPVERVLGLLDGPFPQRPLTAPPFAGARGLRGAFADGGRSLLVPDLDWLTSLSWQESWVADRETAFPWR